MFGRQYFSKSKSSNTRGPAPAVRDEEELSASQGPSLYGAGISLDDPSTRRPGDSYDHDTDDASSINTSVFGDSTVVASGVWKIQGVGSFLGRNKSGGVSLDGKSVKLPGDPDYCYDNDDISLDIFSVNTSVYYKNGVPTEGRKHSKESKVIVPIGTTIGVGNADDESLQKNEYSCIPVWISGARLWIKGIILLGILLLIGATSFLAVVSFTEVGNIGGFGSSDATVTTSPTSAPMIIPTNPPSRSSTRAPKNPESEKPKNDRKFT